MFGLIYALIKFLVCIIVICIVLLVLRTWQLETSADQLVFISTIYPVPVLNGLYKGSVFTGIDLSWQGKKFDATSATGTNLFKDGDNVMERYPFKTYSGKGLHDAAIGVLDIDYDVPQNPFWIRPILDELVQVGPTSYLGKMQLRLIPNYPLTMTFFRLEK